MYRSSPNDDSAQVSKRRRGSDHSHHSLLGHLHTDHVEASPCEFDAVNLLEPTLPSDSILDGSMAFGARSDAGNHSWAAAFATQSLSEQGLPVLPQPALASNTAFQGNGYFGLDGSHSAPVLPDPAFDSATGREFPGASDFGTDFGRIGDNQPSIFGTDSAGNSIPTGSEPQNLLSNVNGNFIASSFACPSSSAVDSLHNRDSSSPHVFQYQQGGVDHRSGYRDDPSAASTCFALGPSSGSLMSHLPGPAQERVSVPGGRTYGSTAARAGLDVPEDRLSAQTQPVQWQAPAELNPAGPNSISETAQVSQNPTDSPWTRSRAADNVTNSRREPSSSPSRFQQQRLTPPNSPARPSLGRITPVRDALAKLANDSKALVALHGLIGSHLPSASQLRNVDMRERTLSFTGFPPNVYPDPALLTSLPKVDLDFLAWAFAVNRNGRKAEIARRIIDYLRTPIAWAVPSKRKPVGFGPSSSLTPESRLSRISSMSRSNQHPQSQPYSQTVSTVSNVRPPTRSNRTRDARPTNTIHSDRSDLYNMLVSQMGAAHFTSHPSSGQQNNVNSRKSSSQRRGINALACRSPRGLSAKTTNQPCFAMLLEGYRFMDAENPFNIPVAEPLGVSQTFFLFSSEQLGHGVEPHLSFRTPPSRAPESKTEVQIQLRCLRAELGQPPSNWKQFWPFPAVARVNGHSVPLNQAQRYTSGKLAGIDTATNISPFLRKFRPSSKDLNEVHLSRCGHSTGSSSGTFVVFAQEICVKTCELMKEEVLTRSKAHWKDHYKRFRSKLLPRIDESSVGQDHKERRDNSRAVLEPKDASNFELARMGVVQFMNSDDVASSSMKVSLRCPLMLTRISIPVKGKKCTHVQCFDLEYFLEYTRRSSKFLCPVCNNANALPEDLVVSPYIERALEMFDCDDVEIGSDGSLRALNGRANGASSKYFDEEENATAASTVSNDLSSHAPKRVVKEEAVGMNITEHDTTAVARGASRATGAPDVVDLTLSDDEGSVDNGDARLMTQDSADMQMAQNASALQGSLDPSSGDVTLGRIFSFPHGEGTTDAIAATDTGVDPMDAVCMLSAIRDELVSPATNVVDSCGVIALDSE